MVAEHCHHRRGTILIVNLSCPFSVRRKCAISIAKINGIKTVKETISEFSVVENFGRSFNDAQTK